MLPTDLTPILHTLAASDNKTILLCTGKVGARQNLRFQRFALRMQQLFPAQVVGWLGNDVAAGFNPAAQIEPMDLQTEQREIRFIRRTRQALLAQHYLEPVLPVRLRQRLAKRLGGLPERRRERAIALREEQLIRPEIEQLKREIVTPLRPVSVKEMGGWHSPQTLDYIQKINPYIIASFGCSLLPDTILSTARGIALNQHSGWSPALKGSYTLEWALYHRNLNYLGVTVHETIPAADAGMIFRRGWLALQADDDFATIFCRGGILGTELMLLTIKTIQQVQPLLAFPQGKFGATKIRANYTPLIEHAILRDEFDNWLSGALEQQNVF